MSQFSNKSEPYFYETLLTTLYLCVGFIPNLGAVDKIAPQWLAISFINIIASTYIFKNRKLFSEGISLHLNSWITGLYGAFIIWAALSFFYALNQVEVIVNFSRQFSVFFMLINMAILLSKVKHTNKLFSVIITSIFSIEAIVLINDAFEMINSFGLINSGELRGVTANRNIAAFSLALKIPFVLYLIVIFRSPKLKFLLIGILTIGLLDILIIQSRASYLALGLVFMIFTSYVIFKKQDILVHKFKTVSFFLIPFIVSVLFNQVYFANKGADALSRASTISFSTNDGSVNQRLRYYDDVLTHFSSNPIFGVGLGNWKFKSIDYDKKDIFGYTVPYHAHSDFIQLGAELGLIGFILYLGIFILSFIWSIKMWANPKFTSKDKLFISMLIASLGVYFIDANLNFPIARPQVLVTWSLIIALISFKHKRFKNTNIKYINYKISSSLIIVLIVIGFSSIFISNKVYGSLKNQMLLLNDFNKSQYNTPLSQVIKMDLSIPNVTVTTIPLIDIKARYLVNAKKYDKALEILLKDDNSNPYLFYRESLISTVYEKKGNIDSAYHYAKKAYHGLPNNEIHVAKFVKLAMVKKDIAAVKEAASNLLETHSKTNWQNILTAYIDLVGYGDEQLIQLTEKARLLFLHDQKFLVINKLANVSPENIRKGEDLANQALLFYNKGEYKEASKLFIEASGFNPMEYSYLENAATSFYILEEFGNSMLYSGRVIDQFNPGTGKSEYIHGISKISSGDNSGGCKFINLAVSLGFEDATKIKFKYCN